MSIGEIAKIHCTPDYAYGPDGFPAWGTTNEPEIVSWFAWTHRCIAEEYDTVALLDAGDGNLGNTIDNYRLLINLWCIVMK
jgi:hypothetical protein